jgi:hypothetical protein
MHPLAAGIPQARNTWRRTWPVLRNAWPVVLGVVGPVVAASLGWFCTDNRSDQIRFAGTALQFFGLLLVWLGISSARRAFKRPSVLAAIGQWLRSFRSSIWPRNQTIHVGSASIGLSVGGASVVATGTVKDRTLPQRLDLLEQAVERLRQSSEARANQIEARISSVQAETRKEAAKITSAQDNLRRQMEDLAVGDSHLEIVGFCWLVLATFATSIPDVIAEWI